MRGGLNHAPHTSSSASSEVLVDPNSSQPGSDGSRQVQNSTSQNDRLVLFFKGLAAWGLLLAMGYAFERVYVPVSATHREVDYSAASALLMHSMGFSIFLLYFTGQIRWLVLNGLVGKD